MKKGSIGITVLIILMVLLSGASIVKLAVNEKHRAKESYERIENRYIAESGIEMAASLFLCYLENQEYALSYQNIGGAYLVSDVYAPYLVHEIQETHDADEMNVSIVEQEANDYLSSMGFLDFSRDGGVEVILRTMNDTEGFKLSRLCTDYGFVVGEKGETTEVKSRINPVYLTVKSKYKGGEVMCNIQISDLYAVRKPFAEIDSDERDSVKAWIDVSCVKTEYQNYQNFKVRDGVL